MFLIDDMIEYLDLELIADKWLSFTEALLRFATDKTLFVRQAAIYGIGVLASKLKDQWPQVSD